jgi:RNA polymerase sigma-70 factor (ECF subfamily)
MSATVLEKVSVSTVNYSAWTDEELILEYQATQERACFEELVHRYERELFNYLKHYLGSSESAEDAFQAAFLQVHLKCSQYEEGRNFRPWLYRIATNQAIDLRRKTPRLHVISINASQENDQQTLFEDMLEGNDLDPAEETMRDEQVAEVRNAVTCLPEKLRQVLYLVYFQGMKYDEAAESLGLPYGTVKSRLNAAVKKLNHLLSDNT